jgi:hypothetical protein
MAEDLNATDPRPADGQNNLLAKILRRLRSIVTALDTVSVEIIPGDIEVGAIEVKDADTDVRASVKASAPAGTEAGIVTRNIPSGTQVVEITGPPGTEKVHVTPEGALLVASIPIGYHISEVGALDGRVAHLFHVLGRRSGFNSTSVLQDVAEYLTGDAFPAPLTGVEALEIVSSNANDTNAAGSGARKVKITYINALGDHAVSPAINLNGLTPVATGITALEILWMEVVDIGTVGGVSAGNLDLRTTVGSVIRERISAGGNRSLSCRFMVPAGHTGYLLQWDTAAIGSASQDVRLRATCEGFSRELTTTWLFQDNTYILPGSHTDTTLPYLKVPSLGRIKVSTFTSATGPTNRMDAGFTLICVENP